MCHFCVADVTVLVSSSKKLYSHCSTLSNCIIVTENQISLFFNQAYSLQPIIRPPTGYTVYDLGLGKCLCLCVGVALVCMGQHYQALVW